MTTKEVLRSQVMAQALDGKLDRAGAAVRLGISVRLAKLGVGLWKARRGAGASTGHDVGS